MLHLSALYCKCKPLALVSTRAGRAKLWPPSVEQAQAATSDVGRKHRARSAVVEEARKSLPSGLEETSPAHDMEEAGASHPSSVDR
jgi:hypothetical protein